MTRAILFDLFETLVTESRAPVTRASTLGLQLGLDPDVFRAEWKSRRGRVIRGQLTFRQALLDIGDVLGRSPDGTQLERMCRTRIKEKAVPFGSVEARVLTVVGKLREQGIRLAVISNCFAEDVRAWSVCPLMERFDCSLFSFEIGLAKPDPEIYREALRRLGTSAEEALFVGDEMDELQGAERVGIRAFQATWFRRGLPVSPGGLQDVEDVLRLIE